jgi:hypothetical protein
MSHELFLQGKLLAETSNPTPNGSKGQEHGAPCRSSVVLKWFDTAILDDLINHLSSNAYNRELLHRAKVGSMTMSEEVGYCYWLLIFVWPIHGFIHAHYGCQTSDKNSTLCMLNHILLRVIF